jgi:hypothetical protein
MSLCQTSLTFSHASKKYPNSYIHYTPQFKNNAYKCKSTTECFNLSCVMMSRGILQQPILPKLAVTLVTVLHLALNIYNQEFIFNNDI